MREPQVAPNPGSVRFAILLAWIAGGVDAIGYLALAHLFTAHMSGNTIALGAYIATADASEVLRRGAAIILFCIGIALGSGVAEIRADGGRRHPTVLVFGVESLLLVAFVIATQVAPLPSSDDWRFFLLVALPTLAMGLQSAAVRRIGPLHVRTTFITGVLASLVERLVRRVLRHTNESELDLRLYGSVSAAYLIGGTMGGLSFARAGAPGMILPVMGLAAAIAFDLRHPYGLASDPNTA